MSSIFGMATNTCTWKRATAYVLDAVAVAASHSPTRQPVRASCVQVRLQGSAPAGTVTVAGTVAGVADTEVLTWTGTAGYRATVKQFTALTPFTPSLTGATTIDAQAVGLDGQPQAATYAIATGLPVHVRHDSGRWPLEPPGGERKARATARVQYEDTWAPRQGDIVDLDTGETWEVIAAPRKGGGLRPDHWVVTLEQREGR